MNKSQLEDLLSRYQDGVATTHEKNMVNAYMLMAEKEQADFFDLEKEVIGERLWGKLQPATVSRRFTGSIPLLRSMNHKMRRMAAIWILLAGLLTAGYFLRFQLLDTINPVALATVETGPYEIKQVPLPDGSLVTLAQNSHISFPEYFRGNDRHVLLNGTAFFDIKQEASAPFTVKSGELDIKVLGTSFEVEDLKSGYEASVTVLTGKVKVSQENRELAILGSNQQLKYDKFSKLHDIVHHTDASRETSWISKQLVFNETPLTVVIKTLQVYYGMKMTVPDNLLKKGDTFSGSFDRTETRKQVLDVICLSSGLNYSVTKDSIIVIRK